MVESKIPLLSYGMAYQSSLFEKPRYGRWSKTMKRTSRNNENLKCACRGAHELVWNSIIIVHLNVMLCIFVNIWIYGSSSPTSVCNAYLLYC